MKLTIDVPISASTGMHRGFVRGEIVPELAPHLAHIMTFAVHKNTDVNRSFPMGYGVTNIETGGAIGIDCRTKRATVAAAKTYLAKITAETAKRAMAKVIKGAPNVR